MIRKEIVFSREYLFLFRYAHKLFENEHIVLIKLSKTQGGNLAYLLPIKIGNMESFRCFCLSRVERRTGVLYDKCLSWFNTGEHFG